MADYKALGEGLVAVINVEKYGQCYLAKEIDEKIIQRWSKEKKELKKRIEELENQLNQHQKSNDGICIKKEDALRGSKVKKLNLNERKEVYEMFKSGVSYSRISEKFGVTRNTIKAYIKEFESVSKNVNLRSLTGDKWEYKVVERW